MLLLLSNDISALADPCGSFYGIRLTSFRVGERSLFLGQRGDD